MSREEQLRLLKSFSAIADFNELPEPDESGATRTASKSGHAAVEFLPDKTVLFVQTNGLDALTIAAHAGLLHLFLSELLPNWKQAGRWLNQALESRTTQHFGYSQQRKLITLRPSDAGVFLEVA